VQAIRRSGQADAFALEEFLSATAAAVGVTDEELNTLKNEAGMVLLAMRELPPDLCSQLRAMAADPAQNPTWRDYCVQFLGSGFPRWSAADRQATARYLVEVVEKERGATGGTALLALAYHAQAPEIGEQRVGALALAALRDATYGEGGRISALQVCALLGLVAALPEARALAASATAPALLRGSAIAALGALGDRSDEATLQSLVASTDLRLRIPAVAALKRIEQRFSKEREGVRS
jgi:hypothetical protein